MKMAGCKQIEGQQDVVVPDVVTSHSKCHNYSDSAHVEVLVALGKAGRLEMASYPTNEGWHCEGGYW